MKKNKLLLLSLLASTLLVGCEESTFIGGGDTPVGGVELDGNKTDTILTKQDLYEQLKSSSGGAKAVERLIEMLAEAEYGYKVDATTGKVSIDLATPNGESGLDKYGVRYYHQYFNQFEADIEEIFQDIVDGKSYLDDDGKFDPEKYNEYVTETLDYEAPEGASKYLSAELNATLKYNYDEYIEEELIHDILEKYIYMDYVISSSKYEINFSNQYPVEFEVVKIPQDTTKINGAWTEAFIRDVKAVTRHEGLANHKFGANATDYNFVTFDSDNNMIVFTATDGALNYDVYKSNEEVDKLLNTIYEKSTTGNVVKVTHAKVLDAIKANSSDFVKDEEDSFVINASTVANEDFYGQIEDILIARNLWKIDREVVLARNYDFKTPLYDALIESEKTEAQGFATTYSNSNAKPTKEVVKTKKITAQQTEYHTEKDYYTKANYSSVLPSAITALRGTSASKLYNNLIQYGDGNNFLLPNNDKLEDPVYLDTSSGNYYICEVYNWYGYYVKDADKISTTKEDSSYQIDAYKAGFFYEWDLKKGGTEENPTYTWEKSENRPYNNATYKDAFETRIVDVVQFTAETILTDAIKTEAIVALFEKYGLEVNDQDIYDYMAATYPDYFETEE